MPRCPPLRSAIRSSHRLPHTPGGLRESNSVREELPASSVAPADGSSNVAGNHDGGCSSDLWLGDGRPIRGSIIFVDQYMVRSFSSCIDCAGCRLYIDSGAVDQYSLRTFSNCINCVGCRFYTASKAVSYKLYCFISSSLQFFISLLIANFSFYFVAQV
ncbi:uncharacterized protein LOC116006454 [Ipomoea triloba]|uniref:uncharacterized protein LOC116006454 n=1 Tax=Ipomoea triloba TaxID=35885 RepID=UPI00125E530E|nr:uncharacterized protein LOC116006454 [Ipomoea triloba]